MRVAIYCRVSTEEQALKGFSIDTQKEQLEDYAKKNNHTIIDYYLDYGYSGGTIKRPQLQRLLNDIAYHKIDIVLFTRLDRWFRSVANYYEIQKILEDNNVSWICTEEDYETNTSSGKFKVNIMLSVSQQYKDTTSEKIKDTLDFKVKNGYYPSGSVPLGYKLERTENGSKLVIDEDKKDIVYSFYKNLEIYQSQRQAMSKTNIEFGLNYTKEVYRKLVNNPLYYGEYKGIKNFCPAYIDEDTFNYYKQIINKRYKVGVNKNTYLFSGLIKCPCCNNRLCGNTKTYNGKKVKSLYLGYICSKNHSSKLCSFSKFITEKTFEKKVLSALSQFVNAQYEIELKKSKKKKANPLPKLKQELERLNKIYLKGRINDDYYEKEYARLQSDIEYYSKSSTNISESFKNFIDNDFMDLYKTLEKKEKQTLLHLVIESITIDKDLNITAINFSSVYDNRTSWKNILIHPIFTFLK